MCFDSETLARCSINCCSAASTVHDRLQCCVGLLWCECEFGDDTTSAHAHKHFHSVLCTFSPALTRAMHRHSRVACGRGAVLTRLSWRRELSEPHSALLLILQSQCVMCLLLPHIATNWRTMRSHIALHWWPVERGRREDLSPNEKSEREAGYEEACSFGIGRNQLRAGIERAGVHCFVCWL
jgi:hypothetical protein